MTKEKRLKKRHNAEKRFRFYGLASIFLALLFVLILVQNIFSKGSSAFMKTAINVEVFYDPELLGVKNGAIKDEILECSDGRKRMDGPSYWQIFAEFYYRDVSAPEYCRYYSRNNHAFKMHGKTCLKSNGRWEIK